MGDALSDILGRGSETSARDPHATTATVDSTINEDDGETACDLDGLRAAHVQSAPSVWWQTSVHASCARSSL